jgi:hypothetical protein
MIVVHPHDPGVSSSTAQRAGQDTSEQDARRPTASRGCSPDSERQVALAPFTKRRGQDRKGGRGKQCGAEALEGAKSDQRALRPGEAVEQRADGEEREAGHEEAATAEQISKTAPEQENAAEEDRVGGDHPLQALLREVKVGPDRGQGYIHDRDVQDDHELGGDDHRQGDPAFRVSLGVSRGLCHNLSAHPLAPSIVDAEHDNKCQRLVATLIP